MAAFFATAAALAVAAASQAAFLTALEDVPLPPGIAERADTLAEFDGPQGRIVAVQAAGAIEPAALTAFYDAAMPSLGWTREGGVFVRDRARLSITFRRDGAGLTISYRLVERPASLALE